MGQNDERIVLGLDVSGVKKGAEEASTAFKKVGEAAEATGQKMADATGKASKGTADFGRSALEVGRVAQDFAQGGIGGIINNLEGLARALGGGPGLAGVATLAGVAFLTLRKPVGDFFDSLINGSNQAPKATDALARMNEELDRGKTRLKELGGEQTLTNAELAEYKKLTEDVVGLEKEANAEREKRNALEAQRKKEAAPDAESQKAVSEAMKAAGGADKVIADVQAARPGATNAARAQLDQLTKARDAELATAASPNAKADVNARYRPQVQEAQATLDKAAADAKAAASDLVAKALQGDQGAVRGLDAALPGRGFDSATNEAVAQRKAALEAGEEQARRDKAFQERRAKEAAERQKARDADDAEQAKAEKHADAEQRAQADRMARFQLDQKAAEKEAAAKAAKEAPAKERDALQKRARNIAEVQEGRARGQLQQYAAQEFGVDLQGDQLNDAMEAMRQFSGAGASFEQAAGGAIGQVIQNQMAMADKLQQMAQFWQQRQQQAARVPSILGWGMGQ